MSNVTQRNPQSVPLTAINQVDSSSTVKNPDLNLATAINTQRKNFSHLPAGTILLGKYVVKRRLDVISGEADIYICEHNGEEYAAKIYNRKDAVKPEIVEKLKELDSPYVAKIYDTGTHEGNSVAILPYYKLGSLQGKNFSLKSLIRMVIPCVNEALLALHKRGILHKDLKPANIMFLSDNSGVALIDFGISSVIENDVSLIVTKSGLTFAYAAPEALHGAYLQESDYYSFGITLYELFCGKNPYANLTPEEVVLFSSIQKLPFPEDMSPNLKDLITGLTYNDLTNRNDPKNPNRRWTYNEVKNWLDGKEQPIPGAIAEVAESTRFGGVYKFCGKSYDNINSLVLALAENWSEGKKHLTKQLLSGFLKPRDTELTEYCVDAEGEIQSGKDEDVVFWKLLYKLAPDTKAFFWRGKIFSSLKSFGEDMLSNLRSSNARAQVFWNEILDKRLISQYLELHSQSRGLINGLQALEITNRDRTDGRIKYYLTAYFLMGRTELLVDGKKFSTTEELAEHMNTLLRLSMADFEKFCYKLINDKNALNEEFEAWLIALGKRDELKSWRQSLQIA